jgi:hypothetical protein
MPVTATGLPIAVLLEEKVTVPVGAFPSLAVVMVAVRVTLDPCVILVALVWSAVAVVAGVMVKLVTDEALAFKLASPL